MTKLLERRLLARRELAGGATQPVPLLVGAATTTAWAAVVGMAPLAALVLLTWVLETAGTSSSLDAVRLALSGWLLGHGVPIRLAGAPLGLPPLGITALVVWQLMRAGASTGRAVGAASIRTGLWVVGAVAGFHAVIGGVVALVVGSAVSPLRAVVSAAVVAVLASSAGVLRLPPFRERVLDWLPVPVRAGLRGGAVAALSILAVAAVVAGSCLLLAGDRLVSMIRALDPGAMGLLTLLLICVAYAPTAVVWSAAYCLGPGFALGAGTSVSISSVNLGPLPAFPLLAGLPAGPASGVVRLLLGVALPAGLLAGVLVARRVDLPAWRDLLVATAVSGGLAGLLLGGASIAASGSLGSGHLAVVGPSAWRVTAICAIEVALAAAGAASARRGLQLWSRSHHPQDDV
jgi:hypothetical protein